MGPGTLSVLRSWFALVTPGATETTHRPGASLHHTAMAQTVIGVKDALCIEVRGADGRLQRDDAVLTAHVMLAAARALPDLEPGAYSLSDIARRAFRGERSETAERNRT